MIDDFSSGKIAVAYNVRGSYAEVHSDVQDQIHVIALQDFTTVMLRTVLIPKAAKNRY